MSSRTAADSRACRSALRGRRGFTLIELMVTLSVLAILLAVAVPSFRQLLASNRLQTKGSELVAGFNLARSEAVRRAQPVTLRSSDNDNYAKGWKVTDGDGNALRETGASTGTTTITRVTRTGASAPFTYTASTAAERMLVVFTARGAITATTPAFFRVCDSANSTVRGRIVQINAVGKISIDSVDASCP